MYSSRHTQTKFLLSYILLRIARNNDHPVDDTPGASLLPDTIVCSSRDTESFDTQGNKHA
jgi:hypothetical protein